MIPLDTTLDTARCILRAVSEDDVPFVWSATRFVGFNDGMRWDPPKDQQELVDVSRRNLDSWKRGQSFAFMLVSKADQAPLGRVVLHAGSSAGVWSIGFWIHPEQWGLGYAAEGAEAVIDFGFSRLGAMQIRGGHAIWNTQSRRVFEKLGMRFFGENPCGFEKNGKPVPELEYAVTREEHKGRGGN